MRIADLQLLNNKFPNYLCDQNLAFYMKENYLITLKEKAVHRSG